MKTHRRLPFPGNHCQTIHIRVSIGCISIFFSATRSMPPRWFVCEVGARLTGVPFLGSVEILNIEWREDGKARLAEG